MNSPFGQSILWQILEIYLALIDLQIIGWIQRSLLSEIIFVPFWVKDGPVLDWDRARRNRPRLRESFRIAPTCYNAPLGHPRIQNKLDRSNSILDGSRSDFKIITHHSFWCIVWAWFKRSQSYGKGIALEKHFLSRFHKTRTPVYQIF